MTIGEIVAIAIGGLILALIAGLVTRNIIIAILFPILLIGFLLMWRKIKQETPSSPQEEEEKVVAVKNEVEEDQTLNKPQPIPQVQSQNPQVNNYQQPPQTQSRPPVSTNYPPRQSLR